MEAAGGMVQIPHMATIRAVAGLETILLAAINGTPKDLIGAVATHTKADKEPPAKATTTTTRPIAPEEVSGTMVPTSSKGKEIQVAMAQITDPMVLHRYPRIY